MSDNLYIIMPAYNEGLNIQKVANDYLKIVNKIGNKSKLVIINDGSKDNTKQELMVLEKMYPNIIAINKRNSGHGSTLLYGYKYAIKNKADYVFQVDSDDQTNAEEFWKFWEERKNYDLIIGHRKKREDGFSRVIVTKVLKLVLLLTFKENIKDANTPFRLMNREMLEKLINKVPDDFNLSNVVLTVLFTKYGRVKYIPITFKKRQKGINSINIPKITKIGLKALKDFKYLSKRI